MMSARDVERKLLCSCWCFTRQNSRHLSIYQLLTRPAYTFPLFGGILLAKIVRGRHDLMAIAGLLGYLELHLEL